MIDNDQEYTYLAEGQATYRLQDRLKKFVLQVWDFCDELPTTPAGRSVQNQLTRSASSVGANFRAAFRGRSGKEYLAKLGIREEEADETCYWLDLCRSRPKWKQFHASSDVLYKEANELTAIIVSMINKKKRQQR